jgi:integrase
MCACSLDDGLVNVLRRSSARYAEDRLALRRRTRTVGMSRSMRRGSRAHRTRARECGHKLGNAAGVRPIRLHDARHSCGTALHLRGVPLAVIAKWLGHADASLRRGYTPIARARHCVTLGIAWAELTSS